MHKVTHHTGTEEPVNSSDKVYQQVAPAPLPDATPLKPRGGDCWFGLSRSYWYDLERRGLVHLTRIRLPGNRKPRVLLRREDATAAIAKLSEGQEKESRVKTESCTATSAAATQ